MVGRLLRGAWRLFRKGMEGFPGFGLLVGALGSLGLFRALAWASRWQWRFVTLAELVVCGLVGSFMTWLFWSWADEAKKAKQPIFRGNARLAGFCGSLAVMVLLFTAWHFYHHPGAALALR